MRNRNQLRPSTWGLNKLWFLKTVKQTCKIFGLQKRDTRENCCWKMIKSLIWSSSNGASFSQNTTKIYFFVKYFSLIFHLTSEWTWSSMNWCSMIRARSTVKIKNSIRVMFSFFWQWLRNAVDQTISNSQDHNLIMWLWLSIAFIFL